MATLDRWSLAIQDADARYPAVVQRDGEWWTGWLEGVEGVNAQERTLEGLMESLESALADILATFR